MGYEADLYQEYKALTGKHETIKGHLENNISQYLKEGKATPITIQGPYGSGKTQLLYHLFKSSWEKKMVGIYTQLEKIIPSQEMDASSYANYLSELLNEEANLLRKGESKLMAGKVKDYATSRINEINSEANRIVLFVDEIEQSYNKPSTGEGKYLLGQVPTSDNSPMREVLRAVERGDAGYYLVLAFAPVSFYEFSKGEAQTRSFSPVILPIVEPRNLRDMFREVGNLIWWMGKGRYGWASKIYESFKINIPDISKISRKELQDLCHNAGKIGNVWTLDPDIIEQVDSFEDIRNFLIDLGPKEKGGEIYSGDSKIVKKCRLCNRNDINVQALLENSLRSSKVSKVGIISYYLSVILDALSTSDGKMPLFTDSNDWEELIGIVEDLILEFEGEDRSLSDDLKKLRNDISEFSFNIRHNAQQAAHLEEAYCIAPGFLRSLFPFPVSSPNLASREIKEQREQLGDQTYLGKEEFDSTSIVFLLNEDKVKEYITHESKDFLKETKALVAVNLGTKGEEIDMPRLAQWLKRQNRLKIITPPGALADFLVSFFYWIRNEKQEILPIPRLSNKLREYQSVSQKDKARKITHYSSRVQEYLYSELPILPNSKYILSDKTGFGDFKAGRIGFPVEVSGFAFADGKNDWQALYEFRREFENTQFVLKESSEKRTGIASALEKSCSAR